MKTKWLIESTLIPEDVKPLKQALDNQGFEYKETDIQELYSRPLNEFYDDNDCVVFFGTLNSAHFIRKKAKWIPGLYYHPKNYFCEYYYPALGELLLNREYMMLPFGELHRQKEIIYDKFGEDRAIFLRPNRPDKTFTGKLIYKEYFDKDVDSLGFKQIEPHELVIAAKPINLIEEWRFVCVDGCILTGSSYKKNNLAGSTAGYPPEAYKLAKEVTKKYNPDRAWAIDIGKTKGGRFAVVEVGCFSCCGLYLADRNIIVQEVSRIALEEWKEYQWD